VQVVVLQQEMLVVVVEVVQEDIVHQDMAQVHYEAQL